MGLSDVNLTKHDLKFEASIVSRAAQILIAKEIDFDSSLTWVRVLEKIYHSQNGSYFTWLAITGCYPSRMQIQKFHLNLQSMGFNTAVQILVLERLKELDLAKLLMGTTFITVPEENLVDITHTYSAPYITGIQRVVRNLTDAKSNVRTFIWIGSTGVIKLKNFEEIADSTGNTKLNKDWRIRLVLKLHKYAPAFDRNAIGKLMKGILLPVARMVKRYLILTQAKQELNFSLSGDLTNLLLIGKKVTLPEIPSELTQISNYEAILEYSNIKFQIVLYDFIPFFHAWTVHPGNRGHYNSYVRLVFLAHRIVSISKLVNDQAQLIARAFRLEREEWRTRDQKFDYLPLPTGLQRAEKGEFEKEANLIVMLGSIEPRKNHLLFLSALEILASQDVYPKARILGTAGWENDHVLFRINELKAKGIDLRVESNLKDEELREIMARSQVVLQLSEAEGFGLPIVESLALGTRVIVTNVSPLSEWKEDSVRIVELNDPIQLAWELMRVLENPETKSDKFYQGTTWESWRKMLYS